MYNVINAIRCRSGYVIAAIVILAAGCNNLPPIPTIAVLPTLGRAPTLIAPTLPPQPDLTPTATRTATPTPGPTNTPNPKAIRLDELEASWRAHQIVFSAYITPLLAPLQSAMLVYTFPSTSQQKQQKVSLPPQKFGEQVSFDYSINVNDLPKGEDKVSYHWQFTDKNNNLVISPDALFKITEAISDDPRNDLPVIAAQQSFVSSFPQKAVFTVTLTPASSILYAKFYMTQNAGIYIFNQGVTVNLQDAGKPLTLKFTWTAALGVQIPWQQFESWWVLTDQNGKTWRTEHAYNDYADNRLHKWTITKTQYAVLYTYDRSAADIAALTKATDDSIARLRGEFAYNLLYTPHIVVYNSQRDFTDWAPKDLAEAAIGLASGDWGGAVVAYYSSIKFTGYSIIQHELTHLFQYQSTRSSAQHIPAWWIEGTARYFEQVPLDDYEGRVRRIVKVYGPPNLTLNIGITAPDGSDIAWPYYVGMTFIKFLKTTYGEDALAKTHIALARDLALSDALQMATGKTLADLNTEWGAWISK